MLSGSSAAGVLGRPLPFSKVQALPHHETTPVHALPNATEQGINTRADTSKNFLFSLPVELQFHIFTYLPYPDILVLTLTHTHLRELVTPFSTVALRVEWLTARSAAGLQTAYFGRLNMRTDRDFLQNADVQQCLKAWRCHYDCAIVARREMSESRRDFDYPNGVCRSRNPRAEKGAKWQCPMFKCQINPNVTDCRGTRDIERCAVIYTMLWDRLTILENERGEWRVGSPRVAALAAFDAGISSQSVRFNARRRPQDGSLYVAAVMLQILYHIIIRIVSLADLRSLNRRRRRWVLQGWTWLERIAIIALVAHCICGIDVLTLTESWGEHYRLQWLCQGFRE